MNQQASAASPRASAATPNRPRLAPLALTALALITGVVLPACRGEESDAPPRRFFPDMDNQPKYKAQAESRFYRDYQIPEGEEGVGTSYGRTAREPVVGTVPFGRTYVVGAIDRPNPDGNGDATSDPYVNFNAERYWLADTDPRVFHGKSPNGEWVERIPIPVDHELMALGQKTYSIYCIVCHGGTAVGGDQAGLVGLRWQYDIPNLHLPQWQPGNDGNQSKDGYLFDVIRNGLRNEGGVLEYRMPPYRNRIDVREAWATVAYLRALQAARRADLSVVSENDRVQLNQQLGPPADMPTDGGEQ